MKTHFPRRRGHSERGVALVITLIFLAVITFMAVTFLIVSRREADAVDYMTQQTTSRFVAASGVDAAIGRLGAHMLTVGNGYDFGLEVSTNYNADGGFRRGLARSITNVGYFVNPGSSVLVSGADLQAMLNNQLILPRPPVFISTNASLNLPYDFRYYLDLNRNGMFDPSGEQLQFDDSGRVLLTVNNQAISNVMVGDPQFVGVLDRPDAFHSASNYYVGRYAWIAMPIGNSLDINYTHNDAKFLSNPGPGAPIGDGSDDGFIRNQGVGPWEINLAGFLSSLNTNIWGTNNNNYLYQTALNTRSSGAAFANAASILHYRYNWSVTNLNSFSNDFAIGSRIGINFVDFYGNGGPNGALMSGTLPPAYYTNPMALYWPGSDSPNAFATTQDPFNLVNNRSASPSTLYASFATNLLNAGLPRSPFNGPNPSTYNRYTYYRMLAQMSLGSAPESSGKMNLNYANVGTGASATNFAPWQPVQFFTNAAIRMIQARPELAALGLCTNNTIYIPVYPTNYYTPAVHRLFQLAANIYDASTNKANSNPTSYDPPSVFSPYFAMRLVRGGNGVTYTNIYITGYRQAITTNSGGGSFYVGWNSTLPLDLRRDTNRNALILSTSPNINNPNFVNIYGVPFVVGAKKGFPNINSFSMVPEIQMMRKMAIIKNAGNPTSQALWQTNIQYVLGISNSFGVGCWNSYSNAYYGRNVRITASDEVTMSLTNQLGQIVAIANLFLSNQVDIVTNSRVPWYGAPKDFSRPTLANSFKLVLSTNYVFLGDSVLQNTAPYAPTRSTTFPTLPIPVSARNFIAKYGLLVTNRVRVMIQDLTNGVPGQLIDYVQLGGLGQQPGLDTFDDLTWDLAAQDHTFSPTNKYWFWQTNQIRPNINLLPVGFFNQIAISEDQANINPSVWSPVLYPSASVSSISNEIAGFLKFLADPTQLSNQVPYTPVAHFTNAYTWSANDPLVHFLASDLLDMTSYQITNTLVTNAGVISLTGPMLWNTNTVGVPTLISWNTNTLLGLSWHLNYNRYQPWGVSSPDPRMTTTKANIGFKDPVITRSDDWQFLANQFPNVGWLGRVHRGTPWQTVYLKSTPAPTPPSTAATVQATWQFWTGDLAAYVVAYTNFNTGAWSNALVTDSTISAPANDWELMDLFTTAPTPNASRGRLSINQTNLAAWAAVLDGVIALTNNTTYNVGPTIIDPANSVTLALQNGAKITTNSLQYLVASINSQRTNFPGGVFTNLGDILSVPALTLASPFVNPALPLPPTNGLDWDAVYERIPQQVMSLLTVGTPRYVIYSYGQSLKPAPNSIVTSGPYFGTCTNYEITGEVVTRTIVRFDNPLYAGLNPPVPAPRAPNPVVPGQPMVPGMQLLPGQRALRPVIESVQVLKPE